MMRICLFACVWMLLPLTALAGPNAGGALIVHANPSLTYTTGQNFCGESGLAHCSTAQDSLPYEPEVARVWFVLASFNPSAQPRLKAVSFGIDYDSTRLVVLASGSCADFEIPDDRWPAPGTGTGQSWTECRTSELTECYWFAGYTYEAPGSPDTTSFAVVPHPRHGAVFVDDSMPPQEDTVQDLGRLGFGQPGALVCFRVPSPPQLEMSSFEFDEQELPTPEEQAEREPGKYWHEAVEASPTWDELLSDTLFDQLWSLRSGVEFDTLMFSGLPYRVYRNAFYLDPLEGMAPEKRARWMLIEQAADSVRGIADPVQQATRYLEVLRQLDPNHEFCSRTWLDDSEVTLELPPFTVYDHRFRGGSVGLPSLAPRVLPPEPRDIETEKDVLRQLLVDGVWLVGDLRGHTNVPRQGVQRVAEIIAAVQSGQDPDELLECEQHPKDPLCSPILRRFFQQLRGDR